MKKKHQSFDPPAFLNPDEEAGKRMDEIVARIGFIRGTLVILDEHLAEILGISVSQLLKPFAAREPVPGEISFPTERHEVVGGKVPGVPNFVFTEHGALMAALLLERPDAVALSVQLVRAFIRRRQMLKGEMSAN